MTDPLARLLFAAIWIPFAAMRIYYHRAAGHEQRPTLSPWEGKVIAFLRLFVGLPMFLILILYLVWPAPLAFARFPLPDSVRWLGAGLLALGAVLCFWVNRTLGRNFSGTLALRDDHALVTSGPYRWVRHPMYTAFLLMIVGMLLLSANWLVGGVPLLLVLAVMLLRTPREEVMLLDRFGDEYRRYMERTGRYLPRLARHTPSEGSRPA